VVNIHNILITDTPDSASLHLSDVVRENINTLLQLYPISSHQIYSLKMLSEFIASNFTEDVYNALNRLKPYAFKADLAKYCLLYEYGGIYSDISFYFCKKISWDSKKIVVFRDHMWSSPWDTSNGVIIAPKKHPALKKAIELVCKNVLNKYYGPTPLCPTGPALFGKALASTCDPGEITTGVAKFISKNELNDKAPGVLLPDAESFHCLTLDGELIAIKRKKLDDQGILAFGISGGNSYAEMWRIKDIYG